MINGALGSLEGALLKKRDIHAIVPGVALGNGVIAGNTNEPILDAGVPTGAVNNIVDTLKSLPLLGGLFANAQSGASPPLFSLNGPSSTATKNMGGVSANDVVNTLPATNMVNTPATNNVVNAPAANMVNTPPAANMVNTPATNMANTPATNNMANTPANNMANTPPAANMVNNSATNMATTPTTNTVNAPGTNLVNSPAGNGINAPGTNLVNTPTGNSINAPGTSLGNNGIVHPAGSLGNGIVTPVGSLGNLINSPLNGVVSPASNALSPFLSDLGRTIGEIVVGLAGPFFSFVPGLMSAVPPVTSVLPKAAIQSHVSIPVVDGELEQILNVAVTNSQNSDADSDKEDSADAICEHFNQVSKHSHTRT